MKLNFALLLAAAMVVLLAMGGLKENFAPISEEHNVAVLKQLAAGEWRMRSDEEGEFVYRACPDFDNESVIWAGYIADRARWREYGRCKSIRETGLGFWWRSGHDEYRRIQ